MNNKKNIDRLFQEKFKDFEVAPPDFIWQNLETQLEEKKKKRKSIPIWLRYSGVAAVLIMGMFILGPFINDSGTNPDPAVVGTQEKNSDGSAKITPMDNPVKQGQILPDEEVASGERSKMRNSSAGTTDKSITNPGSSSGYNTAVASENAAGSESNKKDDGIKNTRYRIKGGSYQNDAVAHSSKKNLNRNSNGKASSTSTGNKVNAGARANDRNPNAVNSSEDAIAATNNKTNQTQDTNNGNVTTTRTEGVANLTEASGEENTSDKIIIPDDIKKQAVAQNNTLVDSTTIAEPENELEKLRQEMLANKDKEKSEVAEAGKKNKWNIKPQMAPLFFNTASEGSPIDATLASNSKDFDNDMSYGVGFNYALTDRISIRSGINTVNMKYSTNDVAYYAAFDTQPISTVVSPEGPNSNLVVGNPMASTESGATDIQTERLNGSLVQKMGFIEIPLEMSYKLVNRQFGIDLIGGVSTLFLNDNNVTLLSDKGFRSNMGEARNINNISFSTNVGVGFKYRFFQSFEASFEPMFKYQLNTFSNNDGNFKPYFIGLYSGISFSF